MSETSTYFEENIVVSSSSSSSSEWVPTSKSEVGTSNPQLPQPSTRDVKDQVEDKANPKPWYTADEKSNKMSTVPEGWYSRLSSLQEPANYGTKFEIGIYEEQVKSGYRLPLDFFALRFVEHYHMAPWQLVPNGWRKLAGLIYLV
ncbi:hypothetical protein RJ639_031662 [Escallonia herrerae]|uniref:Transposase (putative) gypsy type domain-containing protein n=1 Tax=Escallonia herrerae TaxID=1293975 RepID=A0AA88WYF8_9ASTE|nr:hypothetical protein RJ639_031662 [Escallonia herrerae]